MEKVASEKNVKNTESQNKDSSKLDFLLDSIDNEIADLSDNVVNEDPMESEPASDGDGAALEHHSNTKITEKLDLDMDLFENTETPPADSESKEKETSAALDALSDAEGEVNAMLAAEGLAGDSEDPIEAATAEAEEDKNAAIALTELLATREVDASKLLGEAKGLKEAAVEPHAVDHQLSNDLFPELAIEPESIEGDAGSEGPLTLDDELSEDLFSDLDKTSDYERDAAQTSAPFPSEERSEMESPSTEENPSDDPLAELGLQCAVEEKKMKPAQEPDLSDSSDNELAALMSNKIEALVTRLVEERLPTIAERIITEKLNTIIASMK